MYKYNKTYRKMQLENAYFQFFFHLANKHLKLQLSIRFSCNIDLLQRQIIREKRAEVFTLYSSVSLLSTIGINILKIVP